MATNARSRGSRLTIPVTQVASAVAPRAAAWCGDASTQPRRVPTHTRARPVRDGLYTISCIGYLAGVSDPRPDNETWSPDDVRLLRGFLRETQAEFANRIGTRQQTVSEWETGASRPRRIARRLLHMVAEERGFYSAAGTAAAGDSAASEPAVDSAGEPPG